MIPASAVTQSWTGDGTTVAFNFAQRVYLASEVAVYTYNPGVDTVPQLQTVGFTVAVAGDNSSATITFTTAPAAGVKVGVIRKTTLSQDINISNTTYVPPSVVEKQMDRQAMMAQEASLWSTLSFDADPFNFTATYRAGCVFAWDTNGNPTLGPTITAIQAVIPNANAAAASATAAAASQTAAAASQTAAAGSASAAATSATASANSATASASSAAAAADSVAANSYTFATATADADPGAGTLQLNNAAPSSATFLYIDNTDADSNAISTILDSFGASTNAIKGLVTLRSKANPNIRYQFNVNGAVVSASGYHKIPIAYVAGSGSLPTTSGGIWLAFARAGDAGSVSSVGMSVPAFLSVSGSPVTSSGTFAVTLSGTALPVVNGGTGSTSLGTSTDVQQGNAKIPTMDQVLSAMAPVALTYGATITPDHSAGTNRTVTLTGNPTIANPTNAKVGWPLTIAFTQDATGSRVPSWGANFSFGAGGTPALSTAANTTDLVSFLCWSSTKFIFTGINRAV